MDKSIGKRDQVYGNFNLESIRADAINLFSFVDTTDTLGLNTNINWSHRLNPYLFLYAGYHFSRLRTLVRPEFENQQNISGAAGIAGNDQDPANWGPPALSFSTAASRRFRTRRARSIAIAPMDFRRQSGCTAGATTSPLAATYARQQFNEYFQQDPRGSFRFTGQVTGSDFADFLIGIPDASSVAFGNADKYFRQTVYDAYATDDWHVLPDLTINAGAR